MCVFTIYWSSIAGWPDAVAIGLARSRIGETYEQADVVSDSIALCGNSQAEDQSDPTTMKFSAIPENLFKAIKALREKRPLKLGGDALIKIKAIEEGLIVEAYSSTATVTADVDVTGEFVTTWKGFGRVLGTYPKGKPVTFAVSGNGLLIDRLRFPVTTGVNPSQQDSVPDTEKLQDGTQLLTAKRSRTRLRADTKRPLDPSRARQLAQAFVTARLELIPWDGPSAGIYDADTQTDFFFFVVRRDRPRVGREECVAVSKSTGVVRSMGFVGD